MDAAGRFYHAEGAAGTLARGDCIGKTVWEANPIVIEILRAHHALLATEKIDHSYPHCWRCHKPTIFRATEQWFIGMDRNDLRQHALDAISQVRWMPAWGEERISNMIATRPDWCISRQRVWGVPIIVFYCDALPRAAHRPQDSGRRRAAVRASTPPTSGIERTAAELLPPGIACAKCGGAEFSKENDILDVWFDSGSSHLAVLTPENDLPWPADLYIEGGDQYRGWFHSSLLVGVGLKGGSPYRACATERLGARWRRPRHAQIARQRHRARRDHQASRRGSVRLWSASVEFTEDVRVSETILDAPARGLPQAAQYVPLLLGNLHDFDPRADAVPVDEMLELDQWILLRAEDLVANCRAWYDEFAFHKVYRALYDFATVDLSALYFDVLKDRLYTAATKSHARRSAQTALYRLEYALVRLLAPILTFTTEEVWTHMGQPGSVHLELFPEARRTDRRTCPKRIGNGPANWDRLMKVREDVLKSLEAGPPGEVHRRAARSSGTPDGQRRPVSAARRVRRGTARRCSSSRRWCVGLGLPACRRSPSRSSAPTASSASAAGSTPPIPAPTRISHHLRGLRRRRRQRCCDD